MFDQLFFIHVQNQMFHENLKCQKSKKNGDKHEIVVQFA